MKNFLVLALLCLLTGCSTYAPGEDTYGRQLQGESEAVLAAIHSYMDDTSRVPNSLDVLVPKYLPALPKEPQIVYTPKTSSLDFEYDQKDKNGLHVHCHALVGQLQWVCY